MNLLTTFPHLDLTAINSKATSRSSENSTAAESAEVKRAAAEFEAILLSQLTSALRSESSEDGESLFGGGESGLAQNLFTEQMAISMANNGGIGLADMIARHISADADAASAEASHVDRAIETSRHLRGSITLPTVTGAVSSNGVPPASAEMLSMTRPRRIAEVINLNVSSRAHGVRLPTRQEIGNIQMETAAIKRAFVETPSSASKPVYTGRPKIDAIIEQASAHFGLDPYLLAAVLHTESSGRQHAVSSKGASGYMQLMPATFRQYAGPGKDIFDPKDNINGGAAYLKFLSSRYGGKT